MQCLVPLKPNPDHHRTSDSPALKLTVGRSVRKRAPDPRKTSRDSPPFEVVPTQKKCGRLAKEAALCSSARAHR